MGSTRAQRSTQTSERGAVASNSKRAASKSGEWDEGSADEGEWSSLGVVETYQELTQLLYTPTEVCPPPKKARKGKKKAKIAGACLLLSFPTDLFYKASRALVLL